MFIYVIRDDSVGRIYPPFYASSDDEARMIIRDQLISPQGIALRGLANDLDVLCVGEIDFSTGLIAGYRGVDDEAEDISFIVFHVSDVLEQIPKTLLEPSVDISMIRDLNSKIKELKTDLEYYKNLYNTHKHSKKGVLLIDDQKKL